MRTDKLEQNSKTSRLVIVLLAVAATVLLIASILLAWLQSPEPQIMTPGAPSPTTQTQDSTL